MTLLGLVRLKNEGSMTRRKAASPFFFTNTATKSFTHGLIGSLPTNPSATGALPMAPEQPLIFFFFGSQPHQLVFSEMNIILYKATMPAREPLYGSLLITEISIECDIL